MAAVYPRKLCRALVLDFKQELRRQGSEVTLLDDYSVLGTHFGTVMARACRPLVANSGESWARRELDRIVHLEDHLQRSREEFLRDEQYATVVDITTGKAKGSDGQDVEMFFALMEGDDGQGLEGTIKSKEPATDEGLADQPPPDPATDGADPLRPEISTADRAQAEHRGRHTWAKANAALTAGQQGWMDKVRRGDLSGVETPL